MAQQSAAQGKFHQSSKAAFPCRPTTMAQAVGFALLAGAAFPVASMPTGGEVAAGSAAIGAPVNGHMQIDQSSQKAILNWQGFSIAGNESVHFQQPGGGVALNRVLGSNPSEIFGRLTASGSLFLVNPNGVFFGPGSSVDVGGLVASTLNLSDSDFLSGSYRFINGGAAKNILNQGQLHAADGGHIALLAPEIRNEGVVSARMGTVAFGAGDQVRLDMNGDNLLGMAVERSAVKSMIENKHMAQIEGGQVIMSARAAGTVADSVLNNAGIIKATGLVERDGVIRLEAGLVAQHGTVDAGANGAVQLQAGDIMHSGTTRAADIAMNAGAIYIDGTVSADSATGAGGSIALTAHALDVASSGSISADGTSGGSISLASDAGGRVLVSGQLSAEGNSGAGGDIKATAWNLSLLGGSASADGATQGGRIWWGGAGPEERGAMTQAEQTQVTGGATLSARGQQGGEIIAYGKTSMDFLGSAHAEGNASNGGFIELSSQDSWRMAEQADINAGAGGTLLIDPKNILISAAGANAQGYAQLALKLGSGTTLADGSTLVPADGDHFGYSVSLSGDRLAVGQTEFSGTQQGSVYLFDGLGASGPIQTPRLANKIGNGSAITDASGTPTTLALNNGDVFGTGVAISGERLVVGAQWAGGHQEGAVYLFDGLSASGPITGTPRLAMKLENGTPISFGGLPNTLTLAAGDNFGNALSLSNDRLAVGSYLDDTGGRFNATTGACEFQCDRGAVYVFDGLGVSGAFNIAPPHLVYKLADSSGVTTTSLSFTDNANFGSAVSLSADRLAVGAWQYGSGTGAVYLFDGLGASGPVLNVRLANTLINGSALAAGGSAATLSLVSGDQFGSSVALDGDRMAVGAYGDGGFHRGAVYMFDGLGASGDVSAAPRQYEKLASGSSIVAADGSAATLNLADGDMFGASVALSGERMAVGAYSDNTGGANRGAVYLFNLGGGSAFASSPATDQTLSAASIASLLSTGQSVVLQASNDITVNAGVTANNASGNGGSFTLQAGRSLLLNAGITSDNGDVRLFANQPASSGVMDADRDAGAAEINMAAGTAINAGTGTVTIRMGDGAGNTHHDSGDITLASVSAGRIDVANQGASAGSDVVVRNGATLNATGSGTNMTLAAAGAGGGSFINQGSANLNSNGGRFLVYSDNPTATIEGVAASKRYATAYGSTAGVGTGNYFLYSIAPVLNVSANAAGKIYGDADPAFSYSATGFIDGDTAGNALTGGQVRAAGETVAGGPYAIGQGSLADQLGYTINYTSADFTITPRTVTVTVGADNKVYDGSTAASLNTAALGNTIGADNISLAIGSSTFADKNAGTGKTVTVAGMTLSGADASNYQLASGTATTNADITPRTVNANVAAANKVYDGTTTATLTASTLDSAVSGDDIGFSVASASFDNANAGAGKTVTASGLALTGADAANYVLNAGSATTTADISARTLALNVGVATNKVYDGTDLATLTGTSLSNVVGSDDVSVAVGDARFSDKNVGIAKTVTASGLVLGGTSAGNYVLPSGTATTTADITPRTATVTVAADNKVYDGSTAASLNTAALSNTIGGDDISFTIGSSNFADKNAGTGKTVTVAGMTLSGTDAANYQLASGTATTSADITPRTVNANVAAANKVYDGATAATLTAITLDAVVSGDDLGLGVASANFDNANAGAGKTVTASGLALTGADAANYMLNAGSATTTADIFARALAVNVGVTAASKVYDGTDLATITGTSLSNVVGSDDVSVTVGDARFSDKNVGIAKTVTASGLVLGGTSAGNYVLPSGTATTTADITPRTVTASVTAADKVYDGTPTASLSTTALGNAIAGDNVVLTAASASFDDRNVGVDKTVTASGLGLSGSDAGNYTLATGSALTTADITLRPLTISANGQTVFVGQSPSLSASYSGLAPTDSSSIVTGLVLFSPATTASPVGSYVITASGASAANYQVTLVDGVLNIVPVPPVVDAGSVMGAAISSAQQLLGTQTANTAVLVAANAAEEENTTTGARSGAQAPRTLLQVQGMRLPEGVAAQ